MYTKTLKPILFKNYFFQLKREFYWKKSLKWHMHENDLIVPTAKKMPLRQF